jgi:hypothetical protein
MRRASIFLLAAILCGGCGGYSRYIKASDIPRDESAYLYGRFEHDEDVAGPWHSTGFPTSITLVGVDGTTRESICFRKDDHVCGIEVTPGQYSIDKWVWRSGMGDKVVEMSLKDHVRDNELHFEAGHAYYLGDFLAYGHTGKSPFETFFVLETPENNFEATTTEFNQKYPSFRDVPKSMLFDPCFFKDEFNKKHVIHQKSRMIFVPIVVGG